jgi:two-component system, sensor histidine kinase and response regulator
MHMLYRKVVLVVDDLEAMRKISAQQLHALGAENVLFGRDGQEALRTLASETVDLVVSDWHMPGMDGLELLRAIRRDERLRGLPFVMNTAESARERMQEVINADISGLLIKPYNTAKFAEAVKRALSWRPRANAPAPVAADAAVPVQPIEPKPALDLPVKAREGGVLIVDDTPENLQLMVPLFNTDTRVRTAADGARALAICHGDDPPDLVLLDVMMPGLSGFDVAQKLREHPLSKLMPVIFVTAINDEASRLQGLRLGAVDFVSKPIDPELLRLRVRNFLHYVELQKRVQGECDALLEIARLRDEVEQITRQDLKGPLSGIVRMVQTLTEEGRFSFVQMSYLQGIESCAHQVMNTISLSSELYKIDTGQFVLQAETFDLVALLRSVADNTQGESHAKRIDITVTAAETPILVSGDRMLCHAVFHNLLRNALSAAPANSKLTIDLHCAAAAIVSIKHHGALSESIRQRFFDKYANTENSAQAGQGAYAARRLTEAQGGTVEVKADTIGNTTELLVNLPMQVSAPTSFELPIA